MAHHVPLTPIDLDLLAVLTHEQARQAGRPLRLLDLAVQRFGVESEARHVLQRLLVHGLIELEQDEQARRSCVGVVTQGATVPPAAGMGLKTPGAEH